MGGGSAGHGDYILMILQWPKGSHGTHPAAMLDPFGWCLVAQFALWDLWFTFQGKRRSLVVRREGGLGNADLAVMPARPRCHAEAGHSCCAVRLKPSHSGSGSWSHLAALQVSWGLSWGSLAGAVRSHPFAAQMDYSCQTSALLCSYLTSPVVSMPGNLTCHF